MKMKELRPLWQMNLDAKDSFTAFLSRALTFTRSVRTIIVEVDGRKLFEVSKKQKSTGRIAPKPKFLKSTAGLFQVAQIERSTVSFSTECGGKAAAVVEYEQFTATAATTLEPEWHRKTQMIMKKR